MGGTGSGRQKAPPEKELRFTPKELAILALLVAGAKNKDIAGELGSSEQGIKNYFRRLFDKAGTWDRTELAVWWIRRTEVAPLEQQLSEMRSRLERHPGTDLPLTAG